MSDKQAQFDAAKAEVYSLYTKIWQGQEAIKAAEKEASKAVETLLDLAPANAVFRFETPAGTKRVVFTKRRDGTYNCKDASNPEV